MSYCTQAQSNCRADASPTSLSAAALSENDVTKCFHRALKSDLYFILNVEAKVLVRIYYGVSRSPER